MQSLKELIAIAPRLPMPLGVLIAEGTAFSVMVQKFIRATLDNAAVKAELGQSWYDDHCKLVEVSTLRIAASKPVAVAA